MKDPKYRVLFLEFQEKTSAIHLLPIFKELSKNSDYAVCLFGETGSYLVKTAKTLGIKIYTYKYVDFNVHQLHTYKHFFKMLFLISKIIWENKINIIHSHRLNWAYLSIISSYIWRIPCVIDLVFFEKLSSRFQTFIIKHDRRSRYLAITEDIKNRFHGLYKIPKKRIFVFCGGIESPKKNIKFKKILPRSFKGKKIVAMVSRFASSKGVDVFIEAAGILADKFKNVRFLFVGYQKNIVWDENYYEYCLRRIKNLGLSDKFKIIEFNHEMEQYYPRFYCTVLPTSMDALGYVLIESLAYKKPVVVTEIDGTPEAVNYGKAGILVPFPPSPVLFAKEVERLLINKKHYQNYAINGYNWFNSNYNVEKNIKKLVNFYARIRF